MRKSDEMRYALGFVLELASAGRSLDDVRPMLKSADGSDGRIPSVRDPFKEDPLPAITRRLYERIYAKTRRRIIDEAKRSQAGKWMPVFQGFRDPVTGKLRFPITFGSTKRNTVISSMTPAQANLVSLLEKHRGMSDLRGVQSKLNSGSGDFEFMKDPTIFNARTGRFTREGRRVFAQAYRHLYGFNPSGMEIPEIESRLFGASSGFDGNPHQFESIAPRAI